MLNNAPRQTYGRIGTDTVSFSYVRYGRKYTGAQLRPSPLTAHLHVAERFVPHISDNSGKEWNVKERLTLASLPRCTVRILFFTHYRPRYTVEL
jgi:hypothetical protein